MTDTLVDHPLPLANARNAYDRNTPTALKPKSYLSGCFVRITARCPNAANVRKWAFWLNPVFSPEINCK